MQTVVLKPIPTEIARNLQRGGEDANGHIPEIHVSDGNGNPCRHCLEMIPKGEEYLIISHQPFSSDQPYAERGPIFLHARECNAYQDNGGLPNALINKEQVIIRGYNNAERIVYGTGMVVPTTDVREEASKLLNLSNVEFVHVRSSVNNCYQMRIEKCGSAED